MNLFLARAIASDTVFAHFVCVRMLHDKDALPTLRYITNYGPNTGLIAVIKWQYQIFAYLVRVYSVII